MRGHPDRSTGHQLRKSWSLAPFHVPDRHMTDLVAVTWWQDPVREPEAVAGNFRRRFDHECPRMYLCPHVSLVPSRTSHSTV